MKLLPKILLRIIAQVRRIKIQAKVKKKTRILIINKKSSSKNKVDKIDELELRINQLISEVERIKDEIEK